MRIPTGGDAALCRQVRERVTRRTGENPVPTVSRRLPPSPDGETALKNNAPYFHLEYGAFFICRFASFLRIRSLQIKKEVLLRKTQILKSLPPSAYSPRARLLWLPSFIFRFFRQFLSLNTTPQIFRYLLVHLFLGLFGELPLLS